jgi:hypothetical protein
MIKSNVNLDFDREDRLGFKEVVFAERKSVETLRYIINQYQKKNSNVLLTHLQAEKYEAIKDDFSSFFYDEVSQVGIVGEGGPINEVPLVAILSAGTSDESVVNETYYTLQFMGVPCHRIQDIGVAGLDRFTKQLDVIRQFKVVIVVAGFEGALASVAGGMLSQPVIAVPTSVGYGVAAGGMAALNAMLASCANGITVVNIDNGYGAAMAAKRIIQTFEK